VTRTRRSLFWTIAGMFLLTVVLGTLVQTLVAVGVLGPLEARDARGRAELMASGIAAQIAAAPRLPLPSEIDTLLARHRATPGGRPAWIVYRAQDGTIVSVPHGRERFLARLPGGKTAPDTTPGEPRRQESRNRLEVIARRSIVRGQAVVGEVLVVRPGRPHGGPGPLGSPTSLLFLPIAVIGSMVVGLVMVRMLIRRLDALETLAARVAEGDLSVRIADASGDEIGRLAERLDRMTERLADARAQLELTERQRRQLFANITHALATPLTSIRGYAETLLDPRIPMSDEDRTRYVRGVLDEARRLDRLTRDLFELARLEAGVSPLVKEPLDWAALCRNTIERFEPRFRDAGLCLVWGESLNEAWIEADGDRLEEVLENLLVNALRYVPAAGTVEVSLGRAGGSDDRFRLTVSDDGSGLPAEELPLVFERFYRGSGSRGAGWTRDDEGSGLGLAIVREIVERHGGSAHAESRAPQGLSIVVELPARG
jgi:signal transduction histidine kinase